jgi:hypothetical protein
MAPPLERVWVHAMCAECWNEREPENPVAIVAGRGHCCFCGERRAAGIYVRENPARVLCLGRHEAPGACWHYPADPDGHETICCSCGDLIRFEVEHERWRTIRKIARRDGLIGPTLGIGAARWEKGAGRLKG